AEAAVLDDDTDDVLRLATVGRGRVDGREPAEQGVVLLVAATGLRGAGLPRDDVARVALEGGVRRPLRVADRSGEPGKDRVADVVGDLDLRGGLRRQVAHDLARAGDPAVLEDLRRDPGLVEDAAVRERRVRGGELQRRHDEVTLP